MLATESLGTITGMGTRGTVAAPTNGAGVADVPEGIVLKRHRDLEGRQWHPWVRRVLLGLVAVVLLLALLDVFGQRASNDSVGSSAAQLEISAPNAVRGGLLFQARFTTAAKQELKDATLVLGSGCLEGLTLNTIEPSPVSEASREGKLVLELGHLPAGSKHVLYVQYQVNPTTVGRRTLTVELDDGDRQVLSTERTLTIFP